MSRHPAAWAHRQAMGDVAIYIHMRSCNDMMNERLGRLLEPHDLTSMGFITLMALYGCTENPSNPSNLSGITGETRANMTRICDGLVDKGWMLRATNADDRRRVDLSLSDTGVALLGQLAPQLRQDAADLYKRTFGEAEKAALKQLLIKFSAGLEAEL